MIKKDAIVTRILTLIQTGILAPGDKLPSLRQIAADNHVSLYTAIGAYDELVAMGVINNVPKVGSFVLECGDNVEQLLKMRNSPADPAGARVAGKRAYLRALYGKPADRPGNREHAALQRVDRGELLRGHAVQHAAGDRPESAGQQKVAVFPG